jgi:hypothetical protein
VAQDAAVGATAYCGIRWGTQPKRAGAVARGQLVNVRAGGHDCYDRLVVDIDRGVAGYAVGYVDEVVRVDSGRAVPLRGGARLAVTVQVPALPTDAIFLPNGDLIDTSGYRTFRQVAWAGASSTQSRVALGLRARLPFRVFVLDGPGQGSQVVVDVAHRS